MYDVKNVYQRQEKQQASQSLSCLPGWKVPSQVVVMHNGIVHPPRDHKKRHFFSRDVILPKPWLITFGACI